MSDTTDDHCGSCDNYHKCGWLIDAKAVDSCQFTPSRFCHLPPEWKRRYIAIDVETTGLDPATSRILSLAVVLFMDGQPSAMLHSLVNPGYGFDLKSADCRRALEVNGLDPIQIASAPNFLDLGFSITTALKWSRVVVGHNVRFDVAMLSAERYRAIGQLSASPRRAEQAFSHMEAPESQLCTMALDSLLRPGSARSNLAAVASRWDVEPGAHDCVSDALCSGRLLHKMVRELPRDLPDALQLQATALAGLDARFASRKEHARG